MPRPRVLFVLTSAQNFADGTPTGWFLSEGAHPYYVLEPHVDIDWASPKGGKAPLDPGSLKFAKEKADDEAQRLLVDEKAKGDEEHPGYERTLKLSEVDQNKYEGIFYVGGHGPLIDLKADEDSINIATHMLKTGRHISAVCHGPAALVGVKDAKGKSIFEGVQATAFSNEEEQEVGLIDKAPFLIEDQIKKLGGHYVKAPKPWLDRVEVARKGAKGSLITGENPASARGVGEALLAELMPQFAKSVQDRHA